MAPGRALAVALLACMVTVSCGKSRAREEAQRREAEAFAAAQAAAQRAQEAERQAAEAELAAHRAEQEEKSRRAEEELRRQTAQSDDATIEELKSRVAATLKDPSSAQFKDVRLVSAVPGLCGEVNARNGFGGYVGFRPFAATKSAAAIADPGCTGTSYEQQVRCLEAEARYNATAKAAGCR